MRSPFIIAIDGRAASGKTTLSVKLADSGVSVVRMDDFFLPPELRTAERLAKPGENFHHERFAEEVLPFLRGNKAFSYRVFDCSAGTYTDTREITPAGIIIVEGSYSCHPILDEYMDLRVFLDVSHDVQLQRIEARNGKKKAAEYAAKWIPLEEAYFEAFEIMQRADIIAN